MCIWESVAGTICIQRKSNMKILDAVCERFNYHIKSLTNIMEDKLLGKCCDMKGEALDSREWSKLLSLKLNKY